MTPQDKHRHNLERLRQACNDCLRSAEQMVGHDGFDEGDASYEQSWLEAIGRLITNAVDRFK